MSSEHVEVLERLRGVLEHGKMGDKCLIAPDLVTAAIASLSAPQSGDWVLVPREASSEMLTAAIDAHLGFEGEDEVDAVWAAMLSAAEQFGATAGHAAPDVGNGAEGGSRAPTRPAHFPGMFPRQDDPASSSLSHQAVDVGQFRPAVATHQLACRKRVRDCREGLLPTDNLPIYLKELAEANRLLDVVDRAAQQSPAEAQPVACDEDRFEQFLQAAIARSPEPLRELGEYLAGVLDDDQWPAADRLLLQLATATPSAPVGVEAVERELHRVYMDHADNRLTTTLLRDMAEAVVALAQQPAAVDRADAQDAEIEALRAEVEKIQALRKHHRARHKSYKRRHADAEARAERLAEALREVESELGPEVPLNHDSGNAVHRALSAAMAALNQEGGNE